MRCHLLYLFLTLLITVSLFGCQNPKLTVPPKGAGSSLLSTDLTNRAEWIENIKLRLRVSYRQSSTDASFGYVPRQLLNQPSLYSTYSSVEIASLLTQPIESPSAILAWLDSQMDENGAYDDKRTKVSKLVMTRWAIKTIKTLGSYPQQSEKTATFIFSLQAPNGLFYDDMTGSDSSIKDNLAATGNALAVLKDLGINLKNIASLQPTRKTLLEYLQTQVTNSPDNPSPSFDVGSFVLAAYDLALLDPQAVTDQVRSALERDLSLLVVSDNPASIFLLASYLDTADALGIEFSDRQVQLVRQALENEIVPNLKLNPGMTTQAGTIEPMLTLHSIRIFKHLNIPYPNQSELEKNLAKYRIRDGWIMFVLPKSGRYTELCVKN